MHDPSIAQSVQFWTACDIVAGMDSFQEENIKAMAAEQVKLKAWDAEKRNLNNQCGPAMSGACTMKPMRPKLYEWVEAELRTTRKQAHRVDRLFELQGLLEKNPDVARILDLIEDLRS